MSKDIRQLFEATRVASFAPGLEGQVLARIGREQKKLAQRKLLIFGLVDVFSATGLVATGFYLANLLASSGFYNYLSLLWSDGGAPASYWQELLLSLVESLPLLGLTAFLAVVLILMLSLAKTVTNFKLFYYQYPRVTLGQFN